MSARALPSLVDDSSGLERVVGGCGFVEGPVWYAPEACLLFNDLFHDVRRRWDGRAGVQIVRQPNRIANGLAVGDGGSLLVCEHATSCVAREWPDGRREILASHFDGKPLNSPNDVVVLSDGTVFFTDPIFGRTAAFGIPRRQEMPFQGVYRIDGRTGELTLAVDNFAQPNGLCCSPDESTLYVADTARAHIRRFALGGATIVRHDGCFATRIGAGRTADGVLDGLKCDCDGNLYAAGPGGVWVFSEAGQRLGVIPVPEPVANIAWGDTDGRTLWIAASTSIYRLRMSVAGTSQAMSR